ncbi:MAG: hypothetical protein WAV74_09995 [Anaerolineae bacterium]
MCVFCASLPAVLSIGVATRADQRRQQQHAEQAGEPVSPPLLPAGPITALTLAGIVAAAVISHTQQGV